MTNAHLRSTPFHWEGSSWRFLRTTPGPDGATLYHYEEWEPRWGAHALALFTVTVDARGHMADEDYDGEIALEERGGLWFRPVRDGDEIPAHCYRDGGELDTAALFQHLLPGLPRARAERLARKAEAWKVERSEGATRRFLEAEVVTWV